MTESKTEEMVLTKQKDVHENKEYTQKEASLVPVIDIKTGLLYCADSQDMYKEFVKMFCDGYEEKRQQLEDFYVQLDWTNYAIKIHALKSTSLSIGAAGLSELAASLEKAGKENNAEFILSRHKEAMALYEAVVKEGNILQGRENILEEE